MPGRAEGLLQLPPSRRRTTAQFLPRGPGPRAAASAQCGLRTLDVPGLEPVDTAGIQRADLIQVFLTGIPKLNQPDARARQRDAAAEHRRSPPCSTRLLDARRDRRRRGRLPERPSFVRRHHRRGAAGDGGRAPARATQAGADTLGDGVSANDVAFQNAFPYVALPDSRVGGRTLTDEGIRERGPAARAGPRAHDALRGAIRMKRALEARRRSRPRWQPASVAAAGRPGRPLAGVR